MSPAIADVVVLLERVFQLLVTASIGGAAVIVAIAALCRFMPRMPPALRCMLWWLAALKLLVALVWIDPIMLRVLPAVEVSQVSQQSASLSIPGSDVAELQHRSGTLRQAARSDVSQQPALSWRALAAAGWIAGALICLGVLVRRIRATMRIVAAASPVDARIAGLVRELCARAGVRRAIEARCSSDIDAPMVVGLLRPSILLPAARFDTLSIAEQRMAICHEIVHVRRGDLWLGCVPALAERLFFFHPLAVVAAREYLLAREAACDRAVLDLLDAAPQEYGRLLLSLGVNPASTGLAAAGSSRSFSSLKRRIAMLGHRSPSSLARLGGWVTAGAAVCALVPIQLGARPSSESPRLLPPHLKPAPWAGLVSGSERVAAAPLTAASAAQKQVAPRTDERVEFVLVNGDRRGVTMSGSWRDGERVKDKYGSERVLWFRQRGKTYVVRDAAALDEAGRINRPMAEIGAKQGAVGAKQGAIGAKQGAVGARQAEIGAKQGAVGAKQGLIGARQGALALRQIAKLSDSEQREIDAERERLDKEMASLNEQMAQLGEEMRAASQPMNQFDDEMRELSREMEALSRQMDDAVAKANREMVTLVERLINEGLAQPEP